MIAVQKGIAEAAIIAAPADIKGKEMGLKRLLQMGTILQIPQAGLAATDETIKNNRAEVIEVLKAAIDGLEYTATQKEDATALIGKWMVLTSAQASKAYDTVKDTFCRDGVPTPRAKQSLHRHARRHRRLKRRPAGGDDLRFFFIGCRRQGIRG